MASHDLEKSTTPDDYVKQVHTLPESVAVADLSPEHRDYLLQRHGTLDLDPMPDMSDAVCNPLRVFPRMRNSSQHKADYRQGPVQLVNVQGQFSSRSALVPHKANSPQKCINLALVAFHAMMSTFTASSIQSAFVNISLDLGISLQKTSYLVSLFIAVLGGAPLFWRPLANRYGRRPIFIISLICSLVGNIGCANSYSYATMGLCRAIVAFFISPAAAIGSAVVAESFFKKDRARALGVWTLLVTIGVPIAPFIFGFVALRVNYRWIYYILAITNGVQLIFYFFFGHETRYLHSGVHNVASGFRQKYLSFRRLDPKPLTWLEFVSPLSFAARPCVMIPAAAYAMVFGFGSVLITIEIPQLYPVLFHFNTQEIGLQYISLIIGSIIGEQIGGISSDRWMTWRTKKIGRRPEPEFRLWLSYSGFLLTICGLVVFLVQTGNIKTYNVTPMIGAAIGAVSTSRGSFEY